MSELLEKILSRENTNTAYKKVKANKGAGGIDDMDLIESYGSGIRRAKDALERNGSPALEFLPDNDIDDYTMAVMYINKEFGGIKAEEEKKTTKETAKEIKNKMKRLMIDDPFITAKEMAVEIGITVGGIQYHIKNMKKNNEIKREGSTKAGKWIVLKMQ